MPKDMWTASRVLLQRLLAWVGMAGVLGAVPPASAGQPPDRAQLEARVAKVRSELARLPVDPAAAPPEATENWNNWPNWSKWSKWANG